MKLDFIAVEELMSSGVEAVSMHPIEEDGVRPIWILEEIRKQLLEGVVVVVDMDEFPDNPDFNPNNVNEWHESPGGELYANMAHTDESYLMMRSKVNRREDGVAEEPLEANMVDRAKLINRCNETELSSTYSSTYNFSNYLERCFKGG